MKVIDIFNSDGTVSPYRLLSDRLPDFLGRYGPEQGYAIVIEAQDPLSLRPGLLRLYEAAIAAGHSPEAVGLPPPKDISMVFQAKLLDREGRMVCNASALKPIREYKEWECAETAARQRLLAALGFGGDVLDADESQDMDDQRLKIRPAKDNPTGTTAAAPPAPPASPAPAVTTRAETTGARREGHGATGLTASSTSGSSGGNRRSGAGPHRHPGSDGQSHSRLGAAATGTSGQAERRADADRQLAGGGQNRPPAAVQTATRRGHPVGGVIHLPQPGRFSSLPGS